jgi:hypothetical protein
MSSSECDFTPNRRLKKQTFNFYIGKKAVLPQKKT